MQKKFFILFITLFLVFTIIQCSGSKPSPLLGKIDLADSINLTSVDESITFTPMGSAYTMDESEFIYCMDRENHRILKIDKGGSFVKQIGSKGKESENLFNPVGIFVRDNILYVLDHNGCKVKQFNTDGEFIEEFEIEGASSTWEIFVDDKYIYLHTFYKDRENFQNHKLFTIFTKDGKPVKQIGDPIPTNHPHSFKVTNRGHFSVVNGNIYIAFVHLPIVAGYDFDGNRILYKDLRKMDIYEVNALGRDAEKRGVDLPTSINGPRARVYIYCDGFSTGHDNHYYYSLRDSILHFDDKFNLLERIKTKEKKRNAIFWKISTTENSKKWGIISVFRQIHLFKI